MKYITKAIYNITKKALPLFISLCLVISSIPAESLANSLLAPPGSSEAAKLSLNTNVNDQAQQITNSPQASNTTANAKKTINPQQPGIFPAIRNIAAIVIFAFVLFLTPAPRTMAEEAKDKPDISHTELKLRETFASPNKSFIGLGAIEAPSKNEGRSSAEILRAVGIKKESTFKEIELLLKLNYTYQDAARRAKYNSNNIIWDLHETFFDIDDKFDTHEKQIPIIQSGKLLEFDKGLIYHGGNNLDKALLNKRVDGECYFTRFPYEWAIGPFGDGAKHPAIFLMNTDNFNRLVQEKKAKLYIDRPKGRRHVEPYPKTFNGFSFDDIKEIWVTKLDYIRYYKIAFLEDISELDENDQKLLQAKVLIRKLIIKGIIRPVHGLKQLAEPSKDDSELEKQIALLFHENSIAVGMEVYKNLYFGEVPFLKAVGEPSPFTGIHKLDLVDELLCKNSKRFNLAVYKARLYLFLFILSITILSIFLYRCGGPKRRKLIKALKFHYPEIFRTLKRTHISMLLNLQKPSQAKVKKIIGTKGTSNPDRKNIANIITAIQSGKYKNAKNTVRAVQSGT